MTVARLKQLVGDLTMAVVGSPSKYRPSLDIGRNVIDGSMGVNIYFWGNLGDIICSGDAYSNDYDFEEKVKAWTAFVRKKNHFTATRVWAKYYLRAET